MRFHWFKDLKTKEIVTLGFTRALFGLAPSPFPLGGVIQQHLKGQEQQHPEVVKEINKSLYVDDLVGLESEEIPLSPASGDTFAKEHLEVKSSQSALLGLLLEKKHNLIRVPDTIQESTTD